MRSTNLRPRRATATIKSEPYFALPSGRGPGVLVIHPWWGLTSAVRDICDRLAKEGFVAIAPDLYGGKLAHTAREARALRSARRAEPMWRTISRALDTLLAHEATQTRRAGVLGLSMGGHWALWFAARPGSPIAAAVVFYAARAAAFARGPDAAFQFHLAERDDFVSPAALARMQKALRLAGRRSETWVYPGTGHWFFEPDRPEHDAKAAALAWTRTLAFLRRELR
ncbi:MAG: dienelactone hydrolase family protein [Deltaproteobacteria bacterium]|nr:dienelactone hydrolase family protein [Deltaproteobacteria bacterium]